MSSMRPANRSWTMPLHVQVLDVLGVLLDERLACRNVLTHQHGEQPIGERGVVERDAEERPALRVHRRLPELGGVHLSEALEPLRLQLLLTVPVRGPELLPLALVVEVMLLLPLLQQVEGWLRDVDVAGLD